MICVLVLDLQRLLGFEQMDARVKVALESQGTYVSFVTVEFLIICLQELTSSQAELLERIQKMKQVPNADARSGFQCSPR